MVKRKIDHVWNNEFQDNFYFLHANEAYIFTVLQFLYPVENKNAHKKHLQAFS